MSKSSKGKRYTEKEKEEILAFVASVNADKGRGGQSAAAKKYQVSPLTIGNWVKQSGMGGGRGSRGGGAGRFASNLRRLADLHEEISRTERELNKLRAEYDMLKGKL